MTLRASLLLATAVSAILFSPLRAADDLAARFASPPDAAKPWAYWWWLNANVTRQSITRDLEAMKAKAKAPNSHSCVCLGRGVPERASRSKV